MTAAHHTQQQQVFLGFWEDFTWVCLLRKIVAVLLVTILIHGAPVWASDNPFDGTVIFLRHALAPGNGDPNNFVLNDCKTQRNLDEPGRKQARAIGKSIAEAKLSLAGIYSSEWCRCIETALLLDLGAITPFSGLNSFYQNHFPRDDTLAKLVDKLDSLPHDRGPVIMVTHFVNIQAITNITVQSGGAVLYHLSTGNAHDLSLAAFSNQP